MEIEFLAFPRKLERKLGLTFGGNQLPFKCSNTMRRQRSKRFGQSQAANTFLPPPHEKPKMKRKIRSALVFSAGLRWGGPLEKANEKLFDCKIYNRKNTKKKKKPHVAASTGKKKKNFDQDREAEKKPRKRVACIEVAISHWRFVMLCGCHNHSPSLPPCLPPRMWMQQIVGSEKERGERRNTRGCVVRSLVTLFFKY